MKNLFFALLIIVSASCKKSADVDPRDQYLGTYATNTIGVVSGPGITGNQAVTFGGTLVVAKGSGSNELTFNDGNDKYTAVLSGSSFTVATYKSSGQINGQNLSFDTSANGSFNGKTITYTETSSGNGYKATGTTTGSRP